MSNIRQYIGARYTPKFMGLYDNTQVYEALSVVDNGSGTSYISGKPVPAGTPLTDTDYWHVYGASSGAIINLQNQIDTINNTTIPGVENEIDTINNTTIPGVENEIDTINNTTIPGIENEIDELRNNIKGKKYLFVGDSYDNYVTGNSWIDRTAAAIGLSSGDYARVSQGGYGFNGSAGGGGKYLSLVRAHTFTDPDEYTDVVVCGGLNDTGVSDSTLFSDMNAFLSGVLAILPNVKRFHIGFMGWIAADNTSLKDGIRTCAKQYEYFCSQHENCNFIENMQYIFTNTQLLGYATATDKFHPVANGITEIVTFLTEYLKTGHADYLAEYSYTYALSTDFSGNTPVEVKISINNSSLAVRIDNNLALGNVNSAWNANGEKTLAKVATNTNGPLYSAFFNAVPFVGGGSSLAGAVFKPLIACFYGGNIVGRIYQAMGSGEYALGLCTTFIYPYNVQ